MERDEETGLQCHGVRYYATWLGRWMSADPIGLGDGVNRFCYCHAGPLGGRDSTGLGALNPGPTFGLLPRAAYDWWETPGNAAHEFYSTNLDLTRSPEERTSGAGHFDSDKFGVAIVGLWLWGGGKEFAVGPNDGERGKLWGDYLKSAPGVQPTAAMLAREIADTRAADPRDGIFDVALKTHAETENGESIVGKQYLHGTNADVGDFGVAGTAIVEHRPGVTVVIENLTYTWNDKIDPNFIYDTDTFKAKAAQSLPGTPADYVVRISWSEQSIWFIDDAGKVTGATGWPTPDRPPPASTP